MRESDTVPEGGAKGRVVPEGPSGVPESCAKVRVVPEGPSGMPESCAKVRVVPGGMPEGVPEGGAWVR